MGMWDWKLVPLVMFGSWGEGGEYGSEWTDLRNCIGAGEGRGKMFG